MIIQTRDRCEVSVSPDEILQFSIPIIGFEFARHFVLVPAAEDSPFCWLHCIEKRELAFPVVNATELGVSYSADEQLLASVKADVADSVKYLVMLAVPQDGSAPRANLRAPIIVNFARRVAAQVDMGEEFPISLPVEPARAVQYQLAEQFA